MSKVPLYLEFGREEPTRFRISGFKFRVSGIGHPVSGLGRRVPVKRFQGRLVFKAHRRVYHSTLARE